MRLDPDTRRVLEIARGGAGDDPAISTREASRFAPILRENRDERRNGWLESVRDLKNLEAFEDVKSDNLQITRNARQTQRQQKRTKKSHRRVSLVE